MYSCDISFRLIGMESRQCLENGTWSGDPPICEGNHCHVKLKDFMCDMCSRFYTTCNLLQLLIVETSLGLQMEQLT